VQEMTNSEIRRKILEMVFACFKEHPYNRITPSEFIEALHIKLSELNYHAIYLEEKGLLELQKPLEGSVFVGARITPQGMDLCEDVYRLDAAFPAGSESKVIPENVFLALDGLIADIEKKHRMNPDTADIILDSITDIKTELKRDTPLFSTIKQQVERIKEKHPDTAHEVLRILKNPSVMRVLNDSLWK
jgi:DNA-binding transcriptional ArsR family regulator